MNALFTVYLSPFTLRFPFSVYPDIGLRVKSKSKVKGKRLTVNGAGGTHVGR